MSLADASGFTGLNRVPALNDYWVDLVRAECSALATNGTAICNLAEGYIGGRGSEGCVCRRRSLAATMTDMREPQVHSPTSEHDLYLVLFITSSGGW